MTTVLVDYESGNLHSAEKAFQRMAAEVGAGPVIVSSDPDEVARATRVVLPGDGAFPACRRGLQSFDGLEEAVIEAVEKRALPFLGICVGMQMLAEWGREYEDVAGFGWIGGEVVRITPSDPEVKVPHMGWNDLVIDRPHPVSRRDRDGDHGLFRPFPYAIARGRPADLLAHVGIMAARSPPSSAPTRFIGTQFHLREKPAARGLRLIAKFPAVAPLTGQGAQSDGASVLRVQTPPIAAPRTPEDPAAARHRQAVTGQNQREVVFLVPVRRIDAAHVIARLASGSVSQMISRPIFGDCIGCRSHRKAPDQLSAERPAADGHLDQAAVAIVVGRRPPASQKRIGRGARPPARRPGPGPTGSFSSVGPPPWLSPDRLPRARGPCKAFDVARGRPALPRPPLAAQSGPRPAEGTPR